MTAVLRATDLHYRFPGGIRALDGVDLELPAQGRVALLGANGAGKTTLLLHLNGSLRPERGHVALDGITCGYDRAALLRWRSRVGLVLQDPEDQLFAGTVADDLAFGPLNLGLAVDEVRARVAEAMAATDIAELADRPVHMLSFGQKRRAAIAGVLAMAPAVLLFDEPTAGLDPAGVANLLGLLRPLTDRNTVLLFSTHDVDMALDFADQVIVMAAGRIIAAGPPTEVLADDAVIAAAALRRPFVLDVARAARDAGLGTLTGPLPRSAAALVEWLAPTRSTPIA